MANTNEQTKVLTAALARVLDADTLAKILPYVGEVKNALMQEVAADTAAVTAQVDAMQDQCNAMSFMGQVVTESEYAELVESGEIVDGRFYAVYPDPEEEESNETTEEQA